MTRPCAPGGCRRRADRYSAAHMRKNYILDANILLHDPQSIFQFDDNTVIIPVGVIEEIDRFKKERTDRGYNARSVVRLLDGLRDSKSLADGVDLEKGGRLKVYCQPHEVMQRTNGHADIEILRVAQRLRDAEPQTPVIVVTKDMNLRIRADANGIRAEDYESDQVELSDLSNPAHETLVSAEQFLQFQETGTLSLSSAALERLERNEYVLLKPNDGGRGSALARVDPLRERLIALKVSEDALWGVKPRNKEQYYAMDALLDDQLQLVTLMGKAGTGKTLLALGGAMHLTLKKRKYKGILVCRPIFPVGRDLGFLPGDIGAKLDPWMKPVSDTLDYLLDVGGGVKGHADATELIKSGLIEVQPLTYIRGRSIANRFVVLDEAQNLTPLEMKTVITRMGQAAKVVLTGDPYQIDNPYVDAGSNGFSYLIDRFRGQPIAAHIELRKGERSVLAELAANLL